MIINNCIIITAGYNRIARLKQCWIPRGHNPFISIYLSNRTRMNGTNKV